jgi:hypothetical protein
MLIPRILIGVLLLLLGRKVFWLFVAGMGFVVAADVATRLVQVQTDWLVLAIALAAGAVGALLAVFVQKFAVGAVGFLTGGYMVFGLLNLLDPQMGVAAWLFVFLGGIVGAVLALLLLDWALILLSSLSGAALVVRPLDLGQALSPVAFLGLLLVGFMVQARAKRGE